MKRLRLNCINIIELLGGVGHAGRPVRGGINRTAGATKGSCRSRQMGLTLMELIIIMAIIAILSGIAIPLYLGQIEKARVIKAIAQLDNLQLEITNFELNHNRLPDTLQEIRSKNLNDPWGNPYRYLNFATLEEDSEAEEESPKKKKKKKKGKKSPTEVEDARRRDLYNELLNLEYDLYSCGKDGKSAASITEKQSEDDIVRGQDGNYIGLASQFES
jgi:general secretion pathway protein G